MDFLHRAMNLDVQEVDAGPLDLMLTQSTERLGNLLLGAEGMLVTVGKVSYTFDQNRLVPVRALTRGSDRVQMWTPRSDDRRNARKRRVSRTDSRHSKTGSTGLIGGLGKLLGGGVEGELGETERRNETAGYALFFFLIMGGFYYGWTECDMLRTRFLASVQNSAGAASESNTALRGKVALQRGAVSVVTDKVLWTEKFLALSRNMPAAIWLTDVFLSDQEQQVGVTKVQIKKMVMEGSVLPSTDGHILHIFKYIRALLEDADEFMSDFKSIEFKGAQIDTGEQEQIVKFRIEAIYDASKRVTRITPQGGGDDNPVHQATGAAKKRATEAEKYLPPNIR